MEVLSIISSRGEVANLFDSFIYNYESLLLLSKNCDTAYFARKGDEKVNEIYYHFELEHYDLNAHNFGYNYTEQEVEFIKQYFKQGDIQILDISIRTHSFIDILVQDFKAFLEGNDKDLVKEVLISDPFLGIYPLLL